MLGLKFNEDPLCHRWFVTTHWDLVRSPLSIQLKAMTPISLNLSVGREAVHSSEKEEPGDPAKSP